MPLDSRYAMLAHFARPTVHAPEPTSMLHRTGPMTFRASCLPSSSFSPFSHFSHFFIFSHRSSGVRRYLPRFTARCLPRSLHRPTGFLETRWLVFCYFSFQFVASRSAHHLSLRSNPVPSRPKNSSRQFQTAKYISIGEPKPTTERAASFFPLKVRREPMHRHGWPSAGFAIANGAQDGDRSALTLETNSPAGSQGDTSRRNESKPEEKER